MDNNSKYNFYKYLVCLSYLYDKNLRDLLNINDKKQNVQNFVTNSNVCRNSKILNTLSYQLNTSSSNFTSILHGSIQPIINIVDDAKYISSEAYQYVVKITQNIHKAKVVPTRNVIDFSKIRFPEIKNSRDALKNYLRCLTYLNHITMGKLLHDLGYTYEQFSYFLKKKSNQEVINNLSQLPFTVLKINMNNIKAILNSNNQPMVKLVQKLSKQVNGRKSLKIFMYAITYLYGTNTIQLSKRMGKSPEYINASIRQGTSENISEVFTNIAKTMNIPNIYLQIALAHANLHSAHHAYLNNMNFVTKYIHSPINYHESYHEHEVDRKKIGDSFKRIYNVIDHNEKYNPKYFQHWLWLVILSWGHMFGYSAKKFTYDNFINFHDNSKTTRVKQNGHSYSITNISDWIVILHKFHQQLNFVRHSFSLPRVQESKYADYLYVGQINVGDPLVEDANRKLAKYNGQRLPLTAHFEKSSIKVVNNNSSNKAKEFYQPTIELVDIKHNGILVAHKIWFNYTKGFTKLGQMQRGDLIGLTARVKKFFGGKAGKNTLLLANYGLSYPAGMKSIRRVHARNFMPVPSDSASLTGYAIAQNKTAGYDFSIGNYGYARYCMKSYEDWKHQLKVNTQ